MPDCSLACPMVQIALYQPKIPPNTGNIARHCVGLNTRLHLIGPLEFDLSDHSVKRAGLDYWPHLKLVEHHTPEVFLDWLDNRKPWLVSKRGTIRYDRAPYRSDDVLLFGNELDGLPDSWMTRWSDRIVFIPILGNIRSYNLANSVAVVLSQACLATGEFDD